MVISTSGFCLDKNEEKKSCRVKRKIVMEKKSP